MRLGLDLTSVAQWRARLARTPAVRVAAFCPAEREWCRDDPQRFATAWAVKEATIKLLGTGFDGIGWHGVWSRPGADPERLQIGLGPEALSAIAGGQLDGPLRCAVARDGDRVLALLVAGAGPVAVRAVALPCGDRSSRRRESHAGARRAGLLAARRIGGDPQLAVGWSTPRDGPPRALHADGRTAAASFTHDAGIACAAVAAPAPAAPCTAAPGLAPGGGPVARERVAYVTVLYTDDLLAEVSAAIAEGGDHYE